jgi:DNA primase
MRFSSPFLDEIRARVPLSSLVGRHVQWDRRKSAPGRGDYWACCPFHTEKSPSFHADDRKGRYHCFGCKASGDHFTFLVEKEGLSFPEAVERLAAEAGLPVPASTPDDEAREERRTSLYDVMELAAKHFEAELRAATGAPARAYLEGRGLKGAVLEDFRIGFAPDQRHGLKVRLAEAGITPEMMAEAGLVITGDDIAVPFDRFRGRIMFPIRDHRGRVIAFGGRAVAGDQQAKYLNSPETPLFHKGAVLYNLDRARRPAHEAGQIVAVEGYMDVIAMTRAGFANTVAPLGTALTEDQLRALWRIAPEPVLCFDGDAAGLKAAGRALDLALPYLQPGASLRFALMPGGKDPDDLLNEGGAGAISEVIATALPLVDVLWREALEGNDRATPERRARFETDLEARLARIGERKVQGHYRGEIAARMAALWPAGRAARSPRRVRASGLAPRRPGPFSRRNAAPPWIKPWDERLPPSRELMALARGDHAARSHARRERTILLTVLSHPELLHDEAEHLAEMAFTTPALDSLKAGILDIVALEPDLDREALAAHLKERGLARELDSVAQGAERLDCWFAAVAAALADARIGLRQMLALHRKLVTLERELAGAERAFAEDPTEESLLHLNHIREELRSRIGEEAQIEGFGEASGRPAGALA